MSELISVLLTVSVSCTKAYAAFVAVDETDICLQFGTIPETAIIEISSNIKYLKPLPFAPVQVKIAHGAEPVIACQLELGNNKTALLVLFTKEIDTEIIEQLKSFLKEFKSVAENVREVWKQYGGSAIATRFNSAGYIEKERNDYQSTSTFSMYCWRRFSAPVGGDFYDVYHSDSHALEFSLADVAGKGFNAGFPMAEMKDSLRVLYELKLPEKDLAREANKMMYALFAKHQFATLLHARFNFSLCSFEYIRAGHNPLLYYNASSSAIEYISDDGAGLGILAEEGYKNHIHVYEREFNKGDIFCFFTDGVTEMTNGNGSQFGYDRLRQLINRNVELNAREIGTAIHLEMQTFSDGCDIADDQAFIVLKT